MTPTLLSRTCAPTSGNSRSIANRHAADWLGLEAYANLWIFDKHTRDGPQCQSSFIRWWTTIRSFGCYWFVSSSKICSIYSPRLLDIAAWFISHEYTDNPIHLYMQHASTYIRETQFRNMNMNCDLISLKLTCHIMAYLKYPSKSIEKFINNCIVWSLTH